MVRHVRRERAERGGAGRREDEVHPRGQTPLAPDALRGARRLGRRICSLPAAPRPLARRRLLRGELRLVRLLGAPREVCARLEGGAPPRRLHRSPGSLREDGGDGVDVFERRARTKSNRPAVPLPCRATGTQHSGEGKKGPESLHLQIRVRARICCEFPLPTEAELRCAPRTAWMHTALRLDVELRIKRHTRRSDFCFVLLPHRAPLRPAPPLRALRHLSSFTHSSSKAGKAYALK